MARYRCKICKRDKFQKPIPHNCTMGYLKHYGKKYYKEQYGGSIWEKLNENS